MYRTIDAAFWTDEKVRTLTANARYLLLYLITNPQAHVGGLYCLPLVMIAYQTGLPDTLCDTLSRELEQAEIAYLDRKKDMVWVVNMAKYQMRGEKTERAVASHIKGLPKCHLTARFMDKYPSVKRYIPDTLYHTLCDRVSEFGTQEQDKDKDKDKDKEETDFPPTSGGASGAEPKKAANKPKQKGKPKAKPKPPAPYRQLCDYFYEKWTEIHHNKYPFLKKDGVAMGKLWEYAEQDFDRGADIIDNYMACGDKFFDGHPLSKLIGDMPRFAADAGANIFVSRDWTQEELDEVDAYRATLTEEELKYVGFPTPEEKEKYLEQVRARDRERPAHSDGGAGDRQVV